MDKRIREMCEEIDRQKKLRDAQEGVTEWAEKLIDENDKLREQLAAYQKDAALLNEATLISAAYDFIRATRVFAADDIEYDLFAAGWKAAIAAAMKEKP